MTQLTAKDREVVEPFSNFLSWGERPSAPDSKVEDRRSVPPAWWAFALGHTTWCPPKGEM